MPPDIALRRTRGWPEPVKGLRPLNCLQSNSPGERGVGLRLPGPRAARGFRRGQSSDMEETCGGHVINRSQNSWLSLYVLG